jgi:hypothetical protein
MTENNAQQPQPVNSEPKKPNENGSFHIEGFVKIHDPETQETFVEQRA